MLNNLPQPTFEKSSIYRETVLSWRTVLTSLLERTDQSDDLQPNDDFHDYEAYHERFENSENDGFAQECHRLRGLVLCQGSEMEDALREVVSRLDPSINIRGIRADVLVTQIRIKASAELIADWTQRLELIDSAIDRCDHAAHHPLRVGSVWMDYATGDGGEFVPVISYTDDGEEYGEQEYEQDLVLEQEATLAAVEMLQDLDSTANRDDT